MCVLGYRIGEEVLGGPCGYSIHANAGTCGIYETRGAWPTICAVSRENIQDLTPRRNLTNTKLEQNWYTVLNYRGEVIVFSNFKRSIDILGYRFMQRGVRCAKLTTEVLPATRNEVQSEFTDELCGLRVLLATMKAQTNGCNLRAASLVVQVDPW